MKKVSGYTLFVREKLCRGGNERIGSLSPPKSSADCGNHESKIDRPILAKQMKKLSHSWKNISTKERERFDNAAALERLDISSDVCRKLLNALFEDTSIRVPKRISGYNTFISDYLNGRLPLSVYNESGPPKGSANGLQEASSAWSALSPEEKNIHHEKAKKNGGDLLLHIPIILYNRKNSAMLPLANYFRENFKRLHITGQPSSSTLIKASKEWNYLSKEEKANYSPNLINLRDMKPTNGDSLSSTDLSLAYRDRLTSTLGSNFAQPLLNLLKEYKYEKNLDTLADVDENTKKKLLERLEKVLLSRRLKFFVSKNLLEKKSVKLSQRGESEYHKFVIDKWNEIRTARSEYPDEFSEITKYIASEWSKKKSTKT